MSVVSLTRTAGRYSLWTMLGAIRFDDSGADYRSDVGAPSCGLVGAYRKDPPSEAAFPVALSRQYE